MNKALGTHIMVELSDCNAQILSDVDKVASILVAAAKAANAEVLQTAFHRFSKACRLAAAEFQAKQMLTTEVRRGMPDEDGVYSHVVGKRSNGVAPGAKNRKLSVVR